MKTTSKILLVVILFISFFSCSKDDSNNGMQNPYNSVLISDNNVKDKVLTWQNEYFDKSGESKAAALSNIEFDYDNLQLATKKGIAEDVIVARQIGYKESNSINYSIGFYEKGNNIFEAFIFKMEILSKNLRLVNYLTLTNELLLSVELDSKTKTANIIFSTQGINGSKKIAGQCVADCISDAYTHHGWASVAAWVVSAFFPETVAAIAIDCAINCSGAVN